MTIHNVPSSPSSSWPVGLGPLAASEPRAACLFFFPLLPVADFGTRSAGVPELALPVWAACWVGRAAFSELIAAVSLTVAFCTDGLVLPSTYIHTNYGS